jgi:hypothetical protein
MGKKIKENNTCKDKGDKDILVEIAAVHGDNISPDECIDCINYVGYQVMGIKKDFDLGDYMINGRENTYGKCPCYDGHWFQDKE